MRKDPQKLAMLLQSLSDILVGGTTAMSWAAQDCSCDKGLTSEDLFLESTILLL